MYGFDNETQVSEGSAIIPAGINDNVYLKEVKFEALSEDKDPLLQISFATKNGATLNSIIWPIDPAMVSTPEGKSHTRDIPALGFVKGTPVTHEDAVKREYDNFNTKLKHIATKFVSEEDAIINASSYADFAAKYVALLNKEEYKEVPLRLKVTLNNKDYSQLPKYAPFIELMSVEPTGLKLTQYDKVVPTTAQAAPAPVDSPVDFNFSNDEATF